ncbi:MAG: aminotransferase class IV [Planctomycetota bacterium]|jgi:D-alanine transaminase
MSDILASLDGSIMPLSEARVPVTDRGYLFGDGVYEFLRVYRGRLHLAEGHFRRLTRSLRELGIRHEQAATLPRRVQELVNRSGHAEATVYIQVTRGAAPRAHAFPDHPKPCELFYVSPFADPYAPKRAAGVGVSRHPDIRWGRCDIKSLNLLGNCLAVQAAKEAGNHETLLHKDDGTVTECGHSSFFAVMDGAVITHPQGPRILPGITRELILELAASRNIPVRQRPLRVEELPRCREMFLTSTSAEILPIVRVDANPVHDGVPGPVTRALQEAFSAHLADWLASDEAADSAAI